MLITFIISAAFLLVLTFVIFKIIVRNDYLKYGKLSFVSYTLELVIFALHANFMYIYIPVKWPELPHFPENPVLNIVTYIFLYTGLLIVITAIAQLGFGPTMGRDKNVLKTNGFYKYSRNPQVIGYSLILIAFILCYPSLYAIGWFILLIVMMSFMIKTEEEFLLSKYGDQYQNYCRTVPRIFKIF